jgi:hypothetical protein
MRAGRRLALVYAALTALVGVPLFAGSEHTDVYFAWTIKPPLTAAALGAAYWATLVMNLIASRARVWAEVRVVLGAGLVFTTAMLAATLLHLDRFHLGAGGTVARGVAWAWLVVYCLVPLATAIVLLARPTGRRHPERSMPRPLRAALAAQAVVLLGLGVLLFARPKSDLWPWTLTPLTGRATAAWLLGLGTAALLMAREDDLARCRAPLVAFGLLPVLELIALARYGSTLDWSGNGVWPFLAFLASMLAVGLFGSLATGAHGLVRGQSSSPRL